jgi:hypothetical protein
MHRTAIERDAKWRHLAEVTHGQLYVMVLGTRQQSNLMAELSGWIRANRRMKQIREFAQSDGLVVLTSHDKPALIVLDVERSLRLLCGAEQLARLLAANSLAEAARAISGAEAIGVSDDHDWIKRTLEDLEPAEGVRPKIRSFNPITRIYAVSSVRQPKITRRTLDPQL